MTTALLALLGVAVIVLAAARTVPLTGQPRWTVVALRLAALACLLLSFQGASCHRRAQQPRRIVYLVDVSKSMDAGKQAWAARRLSSLDALRPRQVTRTVIAFGEDARVAVPSGRAPLDDPGAVLAALARTPVNRTSTNLEAGLLAAASELSDRARGRVIILTDGRQTQGAVERILPHLRREGLEVYPIAVPPAEAPNISWEELVVPPVVRQGASIPAKLVMTNGTQRPQPVEVTVQVGGLPILQRRVMVQPGWQAIPLPVPALKSGTLAFDVSVADASGNRLQQRSAVVEVEGPPRILWVQGRASALPLLATALKRRQFELSVVPPQELPEEPGALLDYDAVLLFDVPKSAITAEQAAGLRAYVERLGGGVVMVGLGGQLDVELGQETPLDALLPVRYEPKGLQEAKRRVCVVLLIDRSASMMGPRIAATKRAAVELVRQLAPEDLVGVLAFDAVPYVVVELQRVRDVSAELIEKLVRLKSTGGTDILPALKAATVRLSISGATVKHILLLSDGNTEVDTGVYNRLLDELRSQQITISSIGIGSASVNVGFLTWLAARTGGSYYQLNSLDELPQLIARDTQEAVGQLPFTEGTFTPQRAPEAGWFAGVERWPFLKGYLTATAKPGARVEVEMAAGAQRDPIIAHWRLGLGRVTAFTSDADQRWSPDWIRWDEFEGVWAELMRRTMRPRPTEELFVWMDEAGAAPRLIIDGQLDQPSGELLSADGASALPLALVQQGPFRWRAGVGHLDPGWYRLLIRPPGLRPDRAGGQDGEEGAGVATRWIQVGTAGSRIEQPRLPPDELLLARVASATHGDADLPDRAFVPPVEWTDETLPALAWLLPLALLLMLADVALRGRTML